MKFKTGTQVVCKTTSLANTATARGPSLTPRMKRWATLELVLTVAETGDYGFWFECEDPRRVGPVDLENK